MFEKMTTLRGWNKADWALLVQSKFKGKAMRAYCTSLSLTECMDYSSVLKEAVMKTGQVGSRSLQEKVQGCEKAVKFVTLGDGHRT